MLVKKTSIQNLIDTISLPEHIMRFHTLKRSGANWLGLCPFHEDSNPSFYVYPQNYHCFACKAHGGVLNYEIHRSGLTFKEAVEQLAQTYNIHLEYETSALSEKKNKILALQKEQMQFLEKLNILYRSNIENSNFMAFSKYFNSVGFVKGQYFSSQLWQNQNIQLLNHFYYSSESFKKEILENKDTNKITIPFFKENGDIYGFAFSKATPNLSHNLINNAFNDIDYFTINTQLTPCLQWNLARPEAIKTQQLILVTSILDAITLYNKNISNVVICLDELNINLLKIFSKRVKKLVLILPDTQKGKTFLWKTFLNNIHYSDLSIEVLFWLSRTDKNETFLSLMNHDKVINWLQSADKLPIKVTQLFLESQTKEKDKLSIFKQKLLPHINKIQDQVQKKALLLDIAYRYFYSSSDEIFFKHEISQTQASNPIHKKPVNSNINQFLESSSNPQEEVSELLSLISKCAEFYHKYFLLTKENISYQVYLYLNNRNFTLEDIERWKIGFCPSTHELAKKAKTGIVSQEKLFNLGLIKPSKINSNCYDFFHDRIIIPITNHKGEYVALAGRVLTQDKTKDRTPKYINSPESEIFSKSKILFNLFKSSQAIIANKFVIVVEGYMDCIALVKAGIENVVAVMGTALTKAHLQELSKLTKRIVLCFDNDTAGQNAAKRSFSTSCDFSNIDLEFLALPNSKDPDEFIKNNSKEEFSNLATHMNIPLYEQVALWCHEQSQDYQEFITNIQKEFESLAFSQNQKLKLLVVNHINDKYNINIKDFLYPSNTLHNVTLKHILHEQIDIKTTKEFNWPIKNALELKLLISLLHLKFNELPNRLQNIMLGTANMERSDEKICAQAIEQQFSNTGFKIFLEISAWMVENQHITLSYVGTDIADAFSHETQILIGFSLSDVKILMRFNLQELIKESLSSSTSMVLSENVWNLKNIGFLKFLLRSIKLAHQNGVLSHLFSDVLLNLEVDYIDCSLKAFSSFHFDNELDSQFQFLVAERIKRKNGAFA